MIVQMEKIPSLTPKERAQKLFNKNLELEKKRQKAQKTKIPSDPNAWHQIRENYEAIILEDHAFSEQHNTEFFLWQLHYKRIEEFRAHFRAAKASTRSSEANGGRVPPQPDRIAKIHGRFKAFLSEATGFYHDLIVKIRSKYGLPLGHFCDDSDTRAIMGTDTAKSSDIKKGLVSCHRCLIYLGDLARYKGLYADGEFRVREYSAASSYYLQAASLWPANGNPHHQLAILATYSSDELVAVYLYVRSLAAEIPFSTAKDNLVISFEKNRQSYNQLLDMKKTDGDEEVSMKEKYKRFCIQFVRLNGIIFSRNSLEAFPALLTSVSEAVREILSSGPEEKLNFLTNGTENGLSMLRLVSVLTYTVYNVNKKTEGQSYAEILLHTVVFENACACAFELLTLVVERCLQLHDPSSSILLPGILVFLEWLACYPDVASCTTDNKKSTIAKMSFWKNCIALFNKLLSSQLVLVDDDGDETCFTNMSRYEEGEAESRVALWEDFELRGFLPLLPAQIILNFSRKHSVNAGGNSKEKLTRIKRVIAAGKALASVAMVGQHSVSFNSKTKQFVVGTQQQESEISSQTSYFDPLESSSVEEQVAQNMNLLLEEDEDEDEEIVFKPPVVEIQMDSIGLPWISPQEPNNRDPPVQLIRPCNNIAHHRHPIMDVNNLSLSAEHQASLPDGIKSLRFVENGNLLASETRGAFSNSASFFPPQPSLGFIDSSKMESYVPSSFGVKPPPMFSATSKGQAGRLVRHLGPPPGFSPTRSKHNMPISNMAGTTGSIVVDDYSWLDGYQIPFSTNSLGPPGPPSLENMQFTNNGSISNGTSGLPFPGMQASLVQFQGGSMKGHPEPPLGNMQFMNNGSISNGTCGLPFPGMQTSLVQFQGGSMKGHPEHQSLWNLNPNHGNGYPEQQHGVTGNHQFTPQSEQYQGRPTWNGTYRV